MIIGIAQIDIIWEKSYENIKKIEDFIYRASKGNVDLILFPEMALTGFTMDINKISQSEIEIINWMEETAMKNNINIGIGFAAKIDEKGVNRYAIISKKGQLLVKYTKLHPFSPGGENLKYYKGEDILSCRINEFKITPFICYDLRFPEIFQIASKESQLITVASNWPKSRKDHWKTLLIARAIENQCYVVGINRVGMGDEIEYEGSSMVVDPSGNIMNEISHEEKLIIVEMNSDSVKKVREAFNVKNDRREEIYKLY